jgi:hypothetical protein
MGTHKFIVLTEDSSRGVGSRVVRKGEIGVVCPLYPQEDYAAFPALKIFASVKPLGSLSYRALDSADPLDAAEIAAFYLLHQDILDYTTKLLNWKK